MTDGPEGDVCQAYGETWGQGLKPTSAASCTPCGMQHYVSFVGQKGEMRPWSHAFVGPELVVEGAAYPQVVNAGYAWGYLCPILEQVGSAHGNLFEYCFVEWTKGWGLPSENYVLESADADGHFMVSLRTDFALNTSFGTEIAGSGDSYIYGSEHPWIGPFKAAIREENLLAAIRATNQKIGTTYSENLEEWALVGVEQGTEELGSELLGEHTEDLRFYTQFAGYTPPSATTEAASGVTTSQATLKGQVNPNSVATKYHFEWGKTTSYGYSTDAHAVSGANSEAVSDTISGLDAGTTYHYRIVATNTEGQTSYGNDQSFTTSVTAPSVETKPATNVTATNATLNGSANPHGSETSYYFEYGTTTSYGSVTGEAGAGSGTASVEVSKAIAGLLGDTTYHYRLVARNSVGTSYGNDQSFTTSVTAPSVETKPATNVTATNATLNGSANPHGSETSYYFEYGTTTSYGSVTREAGAGSGTASVEVSKAIAGLLGDTTYHYRLVARNSVGTSYGNDESVETSSSGSSFPVTELLDSFQRAAENPLSDGGKWSELGWDKSIGRVYSATYGWTPSEGGESASESEASGAYWNVKEFTKAAVSVHVFAENRKVYAALWCDAKGSGTSKSGYRLKVLGTGTNYKFKLLLEKWVSGTQTLLAESHEIAFQSGPENIVGLTVISGKVGAWYGTSEANLTIEAEAADTKFTKGDVGIEGINEAAFGETQFRAS